MTFEDLATDDVGGRRYVARDVDGSVSYSLDVMRVLSHGRLVWHVCGFLPEWWENGGRWRLTYQSVRLFFRRKTDAMATYRRGARLIREVAQPRR